MNVKRGVDFPREGNELVYRAIRSEMSQSICRINLASEDPSREINDDVKSCSSTMPSEFLHNSQTFWREFPSIGFMADLV